jgi:hypothetical protein
MDTSTLKFAVIFGIAYLVMRKMSSSRESFEGAPYELVVNPNSSCKKAFRKPKKNTLLYSSVPALPCAGKSVNMLPKQPVDNNNFAQFAPNPKDLIGQNFVDASRWVSLGSMSSRRNINRDLRADIPIPKNNALSPWNQSTIEQQQPTTKPLDCPV